MSVLEEIAGRLRAEGGLLADAVVGEPAGATPHGDAAGPPFARAVEAIREGHLLHCEGLLGRIVATDDPDLALLAGDRLYALGLAELAEIGDLHAVRTMAEVIAAASAARAAGDPEEAERVWDLGARKMAAER